MPGRGPARDVRDGWSWGRRARLLAAIACAILVLGALLPPDGTRIPACPSRLITGVPCPGCGLTRSVTSLEHGDVAKAWRYNPFGIVAMLVILWYVVRPVLGERRVERVENWRLTRAVGWLVLVTFVVHGVARGAGVLPDHTSGALRTLPMP